MYRSVSGTGGDPQVQTGPGGSEPRLTAGETWWVVVDVGQDHGDAGASRQSSYLSTHVFSLDDQQVSVFHLPVQVRESCPHHTFG